MSDDDKKISVSCGDTTPLAIALLILFFWGDPDIADAIIHWLMKP